MSFTRLPRADTPLRLCHRTGSFKAGSLSTCKSPANLRWLEISSIACAGSALLAAWARHKEDSVKEVGPGTRRSFRLEELEGGLEEGRSAFDLSFLQQDDGYDRAVALLRRVRLRDTCTEDTRTSSRTPCPLHRPLRRSCLQRLQFEISSISRLLNPLNSQRRAREKDCHIII